LERWRGEGEGGERKEGEADLEKMETKKSFLGASVLIKR